MNSKKSAAKINYRFDSVTSIASWIHEWTNQNLKKIEQEVFGERLINRNSTKKVISYLTFKVFKTARTFGGVISNVGGILDNVDKKQTELLKKFRFYK